MAKILVLYYSSWGHMEQMAKAAAEGARSTGAEVTMQVRILLLKNLRQHFVERDYDYKRFRVEAQQSKEATAIPEKKQ